MSKKPLPPEKKEECQRLKAIFNAKKNDLGLTQEKLAHALEMNQSSVSHYLNGINPLTHRTDIIRRIDGCNCIAVHRRAVGCRQ